MRVRASSLNYRDLMVLKGGGRGPTKLGVVPLSNGAGEVAAIGEAVTRVKMGDRIGEVLNVMRRLALSGITMIVVTHELGFAREACDTLVFMDAGRIIERR